MSIAIGYRKHSSEAQITIWRIAIKQNKFHRNIEIFYRILILVLLLSSSNTALAIDITKLLCGQPEMSEATLTNECKSNPISRSTICQGNDGKAWCKSASLDIDRVSILRVSFGFRNRHVAMKHVFNIFKWKYEPLVLYDNESSANITLLINENCDIVDKNISFSNEVAKSLQSLAIAFGLRIENAIPNSFPNCK